MPTQSAPVIEIAIPEEAGQAQQDSLRSYTIRHDALLVLVTVIWAGDKLSLLAWIGCGLILTGMIVGSVGKIHLSLRNNTQQSPGSSNQG